eukprot:TRINITY_DN8959_c0_g2_i3.p1 TRINITY_DN8959_c0_g2~~TRINITY_DN8959_c0_g2_i3.p1  ORF type:complete len:410 (+),score=55.44 TRINITY_DN8959_c0_g2_i3:36-1265(+)
MNALNKAKILSWQQISNLVLNKYKEQDWVNGKTSSQATLRLFGQPENSVRVTLYRDHHAWCPYCQKVWLFLEEKKIPYKVRKVTMFCYGTKEAWYKKICPSGMLPALELDGSLITESDQILSSLEKEFGPLYKSMHEGKVKELRKLERVLFQYWCRWLCYPARDEEDEEISKQEFIQIAKAMDNSLSSTPGPFFLDQFSIVDCIFVPYVERMNASLFYYKGFQLRGNPMFPNITRWFEGLETRDTYLGTQSDFHTHCHDLPPQMGGCYRNDTEGQKECEKRVDSCTDFKLPEHGLAEPEESKIFAAARVLKYKDYIVKVNPADDGIIDEGLRCSLTHLLTGESPSPPQGCDEGLRYLKQRINVPRDMPMWSARRLRESLEVAANASGPRVAQPLPTQHRKDQNPANFGK